MNPIPGKNAIKVQFEENPKFPYGTDFVETELGEVLKDPALYNTDKFIVGDSVGPQIDTVMARMPKSEGDPAVLVLEFSEPVNLDSLEEFPFKVKRRPSGVDPTNNIQLDSVHKISDTKWELHLGSNYYPVAGDSIWVKKGENIKDLKGNSSNQNGWFEVGGESPTVVVEVKTRPGEVGFGGPDIINVPLDKPTFIIDPKTETCLNCASDPDKQTQWGQLPSSNGYPNVNFYIEGPVAFSAHMYSHLGHYIYSVKDSILPEHLEDLDQDEEGKYLVNLGFHPVTQEGVLGSGVYIVKLETKTLQVVTDKPVYTDEQGVEIKPEISVNRWVLKLGFARGSNTD